MQCEGFRLQRTVEQVSRSDLAQSLTILLLGGLLVIARMSLGDIVAVFRYWIEWSLRCESFAYRSLAVNLIGCK